jgi:hypothetical protein
VRPSPDYQHGDEGILDAGGAVVQSVDQVTLLSSADKLDSATVATPVLPLVKTVCDDDSVLAGGGVCATTADTAPVTTHRPVVWDISVVKSNVPDAPPELDFRATFARTLRCLASRVCTKWSMRSYPALTTCFSTVPHPECVAIISSVTSLASGSWTPTRVRLRSFIRSVSKRRFYYPYRYWFPPSRTITLP